MKTVVRFLRPYLFGMILCLLFKTAAAFTELAIPKLLANILDEAVPAGDMPAVRALGGGMILLAFLTLVLNLAGNQLAARASGRVARDLRQALFEKTLRLDAGTVDRFGTASLTSRMTTDTYNITAFLARMLRMGVKAPLLLFGGIVLTLIIDWRLALVLIAILPFVCLTVYKITGKSIPAYAEEQKTLDGMVRRVDETADGIRVIKALSKTEYEKDRFRAVSEELQEREIRAGSLTAMTKPITDLILNIGLCAVILLGALLAEYTGFHATGKLLAFMTYFTLILNNMIAMTRVFVQMSRCIASADRVEEVLCSQPLLSALPGDKAENPDFLVFNDVSFSYNKRVDNLKHISFSLARGKTLGIIGATGAGKSTLTALLLRLYDPDAGEIRLAGRDLRSYLPEELHRCFGVAFQNDFIPSGTVRQTVDFFRNLPQENLTEALRRAQADFVAESREGWERPVTFRGTNLSGGQRQRLTVARALAGDPDVLILDDASSALDYRTDRNLRLALREREGKTSVIVSQRISSVRYADLILVLEEGAVVGQGTHDDLMRTCPTYRDIAQVQLGGDAG